MECCNCIHHDLCLQIGFISKDNAPIDCRHFKDKINWVELPCSVGDTVYFIKSAFSYCEKPIEAVVTSINFYKNGWFVRTEPNRTFEKKYINNTVFLSFEEAEKALTDINCNRKEAANGK